MSNKKNTSKKKKNKVTFVDNAKKRDFYHRYKPNTDPFPSYKQIKSGGTIKRSKDSAFGYSKKGLAIILKHKDGDSSILIASHVPYVIKKVFEYDINGDMPTSKICICTHNSDTQPIYTQMSNISNKNFLVNHMGHSDIIYSLPQYAEAIKLFSTKVPLEHVYKYIGFIPEKYAYVHSKGVISKKSDKNTYADVDNGKMSIEHYHVKQDDIVSSMDSLFNLEDSVPCMVTFMILSLTYSKYTNDIPKFVFLLYGESGTFKSTISKHIFGIFQEYYRDAPVNFKITSLASLHKVHLLFRDCVCLYDDVSPSVDGNEEIMSKCESLTRAVGDATGRMVVNKSGNTYNTAPVGLSALTAEFVPLRDTSDIARCVMYRLEKGSISSKELTKIQTQKPEYIRFIVDYISWICTLGDNYIKRLSKRYINYRKQLKSLSSIHNRIPDNMAWLYAGFDMICDFFREYYDVPKEKLNNWKKIFKKGIKKSIAQQKEYMKQRREDKLFIKTITDMVSSKQAFLSKIEVSDNNKKTAALLPRTIGFYDESHVYIVPDSAYAITNQHLKTFTSGYSLTLLALQDKLKSNNLIIPDSDGRSCSRISVNGQRHRILKFKRKHFKINF